MKIYYLLTLLCSTLLCFSTNGQTHTWTGNGDGLFWSDPQNWDLGTIPWSNGIGNVVIPTGDVVSAVVELQFERGEINGGGRLNVNSGFNIINNSESLNTKIFSNITIWNNSEINFLKANGISNGEPVLWNEGAYLFTGNGVDVTFDDLGISYSTPSPGLLEFNGPFSKIGSEAITIRAQTILCCYDIDIFEGSLTLESDAGSSLIGPAINVHPGASLILSGDHLFDSSNGIDSLIDGTIEGYFEIRSNGDKHPSVPYKLFFDLSGDVHLNNVTFIGDGTSTILNRTSVIIPESTTLTLDNLLFSNQEPMLADSMSQIVLTNDAEFRNGNVLTLNEAMIVGTNGEIFRNHNLITISGAVPVEVHGIHFCNWNGFLDIGEYEFIVDDSASFTNYNYEDPPYNTMGEVIGSGIFRFPTYDPDNVNNDGRFIPGPNTNQMQCENFSQSEIGLLTLEINSLSDHDSILNTGTTYFEGGFDITLNYAPQIGDEFVIFQNSSDLTNCAPVSTTSAYFDNLLYVFDVICNSDNITLRLGEILASPGFTNSNFEFYIYPNPISEGSQFVLPEGFEFLPDLKLLIYDFSGQLVVTLNDLTENNFMLEKSALPAGIYLARLESGEKPIAITKMIVK